MPKTTEQTPVEPDWKEVATELAKRVVWAIKFLDCKGSGSVCIQPKDGGEPRIMPWDDWFFDALDKIGYLVDRKAYRDQLNAKSAKKRKRKA